VKALLHATLAIVVAVSLAAEPRATGTRQPAATLAERIGRLTRDSSWTLVDRIPVGFRTFHPQGMVRIGETFFVSSVEVTSAPERFARPSADGFDRSPGAGVGHLFKIDRQGRLLADLHLGNGTIYHPGGIDFDGRAIWVPVAEYRPDSRSILYRVDPATLAATEVLRVADHIGGLVHDVDAGTLNGVSWGSRRFYRWTLGADGRVTNAQRPLAERRRENPSHYVDYQDCQYAGGGLMACTGVADFRPSPGGSVFRLGGLDLVRLAEGRPVHQVPVPVWVPGGRPATQNPSHIEVTPTGLRAFFMPDDDASTIFVYDVALPAAVR
jgi:hypothetical protein